MVRDSVKCWLGMAIVLLGVASNSSAQATRTWVSGVGDDANPCSRTAPCKTFAGAISKTAAGGEIDALDPGGFGTVTITKSITIDGGPNAGGILNSGSNGVNISAGASDIVVLRNLNIQGAGTGLAGIKINSAGTVHVEQCQIENQIQKGIDAQPSFGLRLFVSDTVIRDNINGANGGGIYLAPTPGRKISAYLNRVMIQKNTYGIRGLDDTNTTIRDSDISGNDTHGVIADSNASTVVFNLESCNVSRNTSSGLRSIKAQATIRFGNCMINDNAIGLEQVFGGGLISYTNNRIGGNTTDGTPSGTIALQ